MQWEGQIDPPAADSCRPIIHSEHHHDLTEHY
jgi:hypothetical protein